MTRFLRMRVAALLCACLMLATWASAQSTFGVILGTVKDNSGATVPNAKITITNTDENTTRDVVSNSNGDFEAVNSKPGHYKVEATAAGFQTSTATGLLLVARQTLRVDVTLQLGQVSQSVTVEAGAGVIATDTQTISSSINSGELMSLPANTRASDSTSPYNLIATLPGVQSDNSGNFTIQGNLPSQTQYSVDGISTTDVTGNGPQRKAFTSTEMIAEMKVQAVGNNAEYGQSGDVTTISKSGTNNAHGSVFWYTPEPRVRRKPLWRRHQTAESRERSGRQRRRPGYYPEALQRQRQDIFLRRFRALHVPARRDHSEPRADRSYAEWRFQPRECDGQGSVHWRALCEQYHSDVEV